MCDKATHTCLHAGQSHAQMYPMYDKATRTRAPDAHSPYLLPPNFDTALGTSLQFPGGNPCSPKLLGAVQAFLRVLQGSWGRGCPQDSVLRGVTLLCAYRGPQTLSCPLSVEQPSLEEQEPFPWVSHL